MLSDWQPQVNGKGTGNSAKAGFTFGIAFVNFVPKQEKMALPRMTRLPRYKRFEYTPRHYDPDMDELEDRVRQIKQEMGYEVKRTSGSRTSIRRGSFRKAREQAKVKASRASNIRLIVILALLLIIAYLIFFY